MQTRLLDHLKYLVRFNFLVLFFITFTSNVVNDFFTSFTSENGKSFVITNAVSNRKLETNKYLELLESLLTINHQSIVLSFCLISKISTNETKNEARET